MQVCTQLEPVYIVPVSGMSITSHMSETGTSDISSDSEGWYTVIQMFYIHLCSVRYHQNAAAWTTENG